MPIFVDLAALIVVIVAVARVVNTDTELLAHRQWSKAGWIVLTLWLVWPTRLGVIPVGAIVTLWRTHRIHHSRRNKRDPLGVPFVDGIAVPFARPVADETVREEQS